MKAKHSTLVNNPIQSTHEVILTAEQREITDLVKALHTVDIFKRAALRAANLGTLEDFTKKGDAAYIEVQVQMDNTIRVVLDIHSIG